MRVLTPQIRWDVEIKVEASGGEGIAFGTNDSIKARIEEIKKVSLQQLWQICAQHWESFAAGGKHGAPRWDGIQAWCVFASKAIIRKCIHLEMQAENKDGFNIDNNARRRRFYGNTDNACDRASFMQLELVPGRPDVNPQHPASVCRAPMHRQSMQRRMCCGSMQ